MRSAQSTKPRVSGIVERGLEFVASEAFVPNPTGFRMFSDQ